MPNSALEKAFQKHSKEYHEALYEKIGELTKGESRMKIKQTKQMKLHELIKHVEDNKLYPSSHLVTGGGRRGVCFNKLGAMYFNDYAYDQIELSDTFTVEVEEKLTNRTTLAKVLVLSEGEDFTCHPLIVTNISLREVFDNNMESRLSTKGVYYVKGDDLTEVWTEDGIPTEGVLEV